MHAMTLSCRTEQRNRRVEMQAERTYTRGLRQAAAMVQDRIRKVGEGRGFAVAKVFAHWAEVAGDEIAAITRPVKVCYNRNGFGATLTLLIDGAHGPRLDMERESLRRKVNAVYGYNAIKEIRYTQTSATDFRRKLRAHSVAPPSAEISESARDVAKGVVDPGLRSVLERLACHVLARTIRKAEEKE